MPGSIVRIVHYAKKENMISNKCINLNKCQMITCGHTQSTCEQLNLMDFSNKLQNKNTLPLTDTHTQNNQ